MLALESKTDAALRSFFEAHVDGEIILDPEGRTLFVNERHLELWGVDREDHEVTSEERLPKIRARTKNPDALLETAAARLDRVNTFSWVIPLVDGRTVEVRSAPVFGRGGEHFGRSYTTRDITSQVAAEAALREQEQRNRLLVASLQIGVILVRPDRRVDAANPAAAAILGIPAEQLLGKSATELDWQPMHEDGRPVPFDEFPSNVVMRTGKPCRNLMLSVNSPVHGLRWLLFNAYPVGAAPIDGVMITFQDVTDRREARTEALREQNAAAFRTLVSGAATRLTGVLSAMVLGASEAGACGGLSVEAEASLASIVSMASEANVAVEELVALAGSASDANGYAEATLCIRECLATLGSERRERVVLHLAEGLPRVRFEAELLRRAFGALLQNALEAGQHVTVTAALQERTVQFKTRAAAPAPVPAGQYVAIEIRDDGPGMQLSMERRLFKMFASTKGQGRGLGLAAAAEIAASHCSFIELQSGAQGLTARILIPVR